MDKIDDFLFKYGDTNANSSVRWGYTNDDILAEAANRNRLDVIKYLVENGASIRHDNDIALRNASMNGYLKIVKYIIKNNDIIYVHCSEVLRGASYNGHLKTVQYLIEHLEHIIWYEDYIYTFQDAALGGRLQVIRYMMGLNKIITQGDINSAIQLAAMKGHLRVVKYLYDRNTIRDISIYTSALRYAVDYGHWKVVKYLAKNDTILNHYYKRFYSIHSCLRNSLWFKRYNKRSKYYVASNSKIGKNIRLRLC